MTIALDPNASPASSEAPARRATLPARLLRETAGPLLLLLAFVYLVSWTWLKWLDPVIDFGRELYIPWQLSEGRLPQVDLITSYGPLSHLFNSLLFRVFGASLLTLVYANMTILALATTLAYALLRSFANQLAATAACLVFLVICGFGHLMFTGNFNFITPYSHEATHGFVLGLFGLLCFARFTKSGRASWAFGIGISLGLAFLTKPEIFVPIAGALVPGTLMLLWISPAHRRIGLRTFVYISLAALLPIALIFAWLALHLPANLALHETFGAFTSLLGNSGVVGYSFYRNSAGLDTPLISLSWLAREVVFFSGLLLPSFCLALALRDGKKLPRLLGAIIGFLTAALMLYVCGSWAWPNAGSVMLAGIALTAACQLTLFFMRRKDPVERPARLLRLVAVAFGTLMMLKMILHTRFQQYGFVLGAFPGMLLVVALVDWVPAWLETHHRRGSIFRANALLILAALVFTHFTISTLCMAPKTQTLATGSNAFLADNRAPIFNDALEFLCKNSTPSQTLTVFPEGAMLNFLSKRNSPVPYVIFTPPEFVIFGHDKMVTSIESAHPDFIAVLHRPTNDFGPGRFGIDYATDVRAFIHNNYTPVHLSGAMPFTSDKFGILLLERNDLLTQSARAK